MPSTLNPPKKTNVIYLVLDDMGFSDLGCFGSEVQTPNVDALAADGLLYNNFTVCPRHLRQEPPCSPAVTTMPLEWGRLPIWYLALTARRHRDGLHTERALWPRF